MVATLAQEHAQRAYQVSTKLKRSMVIARTAARARTGPLQDKLLKHSARHVLQTRPRLLKAVLEPPALATWATVATPAQGIAQRALQVSTKLKRSMVIARTAERARTGPLQDKPLKHSARHVLQTRPRLLRAVLEPPALAMQATVATPAEGIAQRALQVSTNLDQAMVIARTATRGNILRAVQCPHASSVQQTPVRLRVAQR
jgi:hypothetical protein